MFCSTFIPYLQLVVLSLLTSKTKALSQKVVVGLQVTLFASPLTFLYSSSQFSLIFLPLVPFFHPYFLEGITLLFLLAFQLLRAVYFQQPSLLSSTWRQVITVVGGHHRQTGSSRFLMAAQPLCSQPWDGWKKEILLTPTQ